MFSEDVISHRLGELYPIGKKLMDVLVFHAKLRSAQNAIKWLLHAFSPSEYTRAHLRFYGHLWPFLMTSLFGIVKDLPFWEAFFKFYPR